MIRKPEKYRGVRRRKGGVRGGEMYSQGGGAKDRNGDIINIHVGGTCYIYKALKLAKTKEISQFLSAIR